MEEKNTIGCHAIDTNINMYDGSTKFVQYIRVGESVLGDDNGRRHVSELFSGQDVLVRVLPKDGLGFKVNINHKLSLKFNNINPKVKSFGTNGFHVEWFELLNHYEPMRHVRKFNNKEEADQLANDLLDTQIIKNMQIIDIPIVELLKWNKWWIQNGHLVLYKVNLITSTFSLELQDTDDCYGFELDGNHRYQTADFYIHHNSNSSK